MSTAGIRRIRNPPLLRNWWQFAAPCVLLVLIVIFGVAQKQPATTANLIEQPFSRGAVVKRDDVANNRGYVHYRIPKRGKRYWLGSIAERFGVAGGWRKIAETTLKQSGKQATDKDISEWQFRLEAGQEVLIPF